MSLQKKFNDFNDIIKLDYDTNAELAEKRDILLNKINGHEDLPSFTKFDQGSYAMNTGVEPFDKDYDIDVGIRFNVNCSDLDILEVKEKMYEILDSHTDLGAEIKKSCVTVYYKKDGELSYHVDLVPYAYDNKDSENKKLFLAFGVEEDETYWKESNPLRLIELIKNKFDDAEERAQYRRVIRYLKRWKNIVFEQSGEEEPPGIGLTILAYHLFEPSDYDSLSNTYDYNDLNALINFADKIKNEFIFVGYSESFRALYNITTYIPEQEEIDDNNIFRKMTDDEMTDFKDEIEALISTLNEVKNEPDLYSQCEKLNEIFGEDFKVPEKKDVSKRQNNNISKGTVSGTH